MNPEKLKSRKYYTTLIMVCLVAVFAIIVFAPKIKMGASCNINNIEYVDLSEKGLSCWDDRFSPQFCPIPHDISCSGNAENIGQLLIDGLKGE